MSFQIKYIYDLVDRISPSLKKIKQNLKSTERQLRKTGVVAQTAFSKMGNSARKLSRGAILPLKSSIGQLLIAFAGIEGARRAVGVLVNFDREMSRVKAVTQATGIEMKKMKDLAKDLGIKTEFTAGQAAAGMAFLGLTGFKTTEILKAMPGVLDLATAGQLDLATAADISSNILKGFNLEASEIDRVVDVMAITLSNANTNIQQLGDAMKFVAPVAAISAISIETASAAIGVLSDSGLQASMAGTGLRRIISELANPTRAAVKEFIKLGLSQEDIDIKSQGLAAVMKKLAPLARDTGAAFKVFGDRGAPAFAVLSKNIKKVERLSTEMLKASGAGKRLADVMRDNLGGDLKALLSAIEGNILRLGEGGLTGSLRTATQATTKFFRAFSDEEAFDKLNISTKAFIDTLKLLGSIIGFVFKTFGFGLKAVQVALDVIVVTVKALQEGMLILIKPLLQLNNLLAGSLGKGLNFGKSLFSGETQNINTTTIQNKATQNQTQTPTATNVGGRLDINFINAPKGTNAAFVPAPANKLDIGVNSIAAGG